MYTVEALRGAAKIAAAENGAIENVLIKIF